ncbi:hypothetical protein R1flu_027813 [Riccia fluitans]|uniref:Uncharacterized protein n=1 Tax=Riccia fluitans TaxID=41844 RepID=A0ABD1XK04_9MARC
MGDVNAKDKWYSSSARPAAMLIAEQRQKSNAKIQPADDSDFDKDAIPADIGQEYHAEQSPTTMEAPEAKKIKSSKAEPDPCTAAQILPHKYYAP